MKMIIFMLLLISLENQAATSDQVCEDLHRLACAPGLYDDGTGVAQNPTYGRNGTEKVVNDLFEKSKSKFKASILDPQNSYFRKTLLSASGLTLNSICDDADVKPKADCVELMAEGAANIAMRRMTGQGRYLSGQKGASGKLQDEAFFADSDVYRKIESDLLEKVKSEPAMKEVDKKVRDSIFPQVKILLLKKIDEMIADPILKKKIMDKITAIKFDGNNCSKEMTGSETVAGVLIPNAFYHPTKNIFKYCSGLALQNKSEFQIASIIGHELSHSIDPCGITLGPQDFSFKYSDNISRAKAQEEFPFAGVLQCLRSKKSIHAIFGRGNPGMGMQSQGSGMQAPATNGDDPDLDEPDQTKGFKNFCSQEQIGEAFADWMSGEILPDYIEKTHPNLTKDQLRNGYSNVWRGMCSESENSFPGFSDPHPPQERRVNYLLLQQPKIRIQMKCPPSNPAGDKVYCPVGGVVTKNSKANAVPAGSGSEKINSTKMGGAR